MDPNDRKYSKEHEWAKVEGDLAIVGITDYAQDQLGDIVYVELPKVGERVEQFKQFGVIESVKTASDLYRAAERRSGRSESGGDRRAGPGQRLSLSGGWLIRLRPDDPATLERELAALLDAKGYADTIA